MSWCSSRKASLNPCWQASPQNRSLGVRCNVRKEGFGMLNAIALGETQPSSGFQNQRSRKKARRTIRANLVFVASSRGINSDTSDDAEDSFASRSVNGSVERRLSLSIPPGLVWREVGFRNTNQGENSYSYPSHRKAILTRRLHHSLHRTSRSKVLSVWAFRCKRSCSLVPIRRSRPFHGKWKVSSCGRRNVRRSSPPWNPSGWEAQDEARMNGKPQPLFRQPGSKSGAGESQTLNCMLERQAIPSIRSSPESEWGAPVAGIWMIPVQSWPLHEDQSVVNHLVWHDNIMSLQHFLVLGGWTTGQERGGIWDEYWHHPREERLH